MCVSGGCVWKGTLRDPPRREDGAKTSFVRLFRGKVFRDESTRFARTILGYILALGDARAEMLPYDRLQRGVESGALCAIGMRRTRCCARGLEIVPTSGKIGRVFPA